MIFFFMQVDAAPVLIARGTWFRRWGSNQRLVGAQSVSAYVNIVTSAIALNTPPPLSLTFSEEKGDTPT